MSDEHSAAYLKYTELDPSEEISGLDVLAFHDTSANSVKKITADETLIAPLLAIDLAAPVVTTGRRVWYNVTGGGAGILLNATPNDGDLVRVTLDGVNSITVIGTINGVTNPNLTGDTNSFDLVFAETASEWKIV